MPAAIAPAKSIIATTMARILGSGVDERVVIRSGGKSVRRIERTISFQAAVIQIKPIVRGSLWNFIRLGGLSNTFHFRIVLVLVEELLLIVGCDGGLSDGGWGRHRRGRIGGGRLFVRLLAFRGLRGPLRPPGRSSDLGCSRRRWRRSAPGESRMRWRPRRSFVRWRVPKPSSGGSRRSAFEQLWKPFHFTSCMMAMTPPALAIAS